MSKTGAKPSVGDGDLVIFLNWRTVTKRAALGTPVRHQR